ncbi:MAG: ribosomal protein S18-alanine N-acetyltransferase [Clostridiales bacterium]|nr:ribosomal protein S18-alanine N-acetyltransferase [Clostridiales bacterium]
MRYEDIPAATALERTVFSEPWTEDGFAVALKQEKNLFFVAVPEEKTNQKNHGYEGTQDNLSKTDADRIKEEPAGTIAGYCGMYTAADEGEITNVAVAETFRQQGVGAALVETVKHEAPKAGVRRIFLEVRASNTAAQTLYLHAGFQFCGTRRNFYRNPTEDARLMCCDLCETADGSVSERTGDGGKDGDF